LRQHYRPRLTAPGKKTKSADLRVLQPIATVCERSATVSAVNPRLKQFATDCNIHRQQSHSHAAKNPVVEHKGSSDEVVDFVLYLAHVRSFWASDDPGQLPATCPTL
jgi:hypothetical protein